MTTHNHTRGAVQCVQTGVIYKNAYAAATAYNATRCAMANHLAGRAPTLRGKTFKRVIAVRSADPAAVQGGQAVSAVRSGE